MTRDMLDMLTLAERMLQSFTFRSARLVDNPSNQTSDTSGGKTYFGQILQSFPLLPEVLNVANNDQLFEFVIMEV